MRFLVSLHLFGFLLVGYSLYSSQQESHKLPDVDNSVQFKEEKSLIYTVELPKQEQKLPVVASRGDLDERAMIQQQRQIRKQQEEIRYYDIPLNRDLQKYIWELCKAYGFPYETTISVIRTESTFNAKADNGIARGLMQINYSDNTLRWLAKETGIPNPDAFDPYQNVKMGIWYLGYLKKYWISKGYTEHVDSFALVSYNRGLGGGIKFVQSGQLSDTYTTKVYRYQNELQSLKSKM